MKKLFVTVGLLLFTFVIYTNVYAFTCSIVDEFGDTITAAKAGDIVYLKDSYINLKSGKLTWTLKANLPTIDSRNYRISISNSGYYYHDGSTQEYNNFIPIALPVFNYIKGATTITYSLSKAGKCSVPLYISTDPLYDKTLLLKGHWHFIYTIISTWTDDYFLTTIMGEKNSQGGYYIYGTDEYGGPVVAAYYPSYGVWSLLDPGSIIDLFYMFYTDGVSVLPGSCYFQAKNGSITSACYPLSGYKTAISEQSITRKVSSDKIRGERTREQETEPATVDPWIAEQYFIMKGMMR